MGNAQRVIKDPGRRFRRVVKEHTQEGRVLAPDPVVRGQDGRFRIRHRVHEFVERRIEGWVLVWPVDDGTTLHKRTS